MLKHAHTHCPDLSEPVAGATDSCDRPGHRLQLPGAVAGKRQCDLSTRSGWRVFFNPGSFTAQAENGTVDTQFMRTINENICFLSQVQLRNVDSAQEDVFCRIGLTGGGLYFLQAVSESGFDGDAFCQAVCLSYNVDF